MVDLNGFNAANVEPNVGFTPIPTNDYKMAITDSQLKPNSKKTGNYTELWFSVTEGEYTGRKVPVRLNLDNPSAQAVEIAKGDLSAICRAVNVMAPRDSVELHNLPMMCKVIVEPRSDKPTEMTNTIKGFAAVGSQTTAPSTPQSAVDPPPYQQPPATAGAGGGPGTW